MLLIPRSQGAGRGKHCLVVMASDVGRPGLELMFESHFRSHLRILQRHRETERSKVLPAGTWVASLALTLSWPCKTHSPGCVVFSMPHQLPSNGLNGVTSGSDSALFLLDSSDWGSKVLQRSLAFRAWTLKPSLPLPLGLQQLRVGRRPSPL